MAEEILISITPTEVRVALIETAVLIKDNILQEIHIEQEPLRSLVGNIYCESIESFTQHASRLCRYRFTESGFFTSRHGHNPSRSRRSNTHRTNNKRYFRRKGRSSYHSVIPHITLLVFTPHSNCTGSRTENHIGISKRINSDKEKDRLRKLLSACIKTEDRFIIRTAAENITKNTLSEDAHHLSQRWQVVQENISRLKNIRSSNTRRSIGIVHEEPSLYLRTVQDLIKPTTHKIRIDSKKEYQQLIEFTNKHCLLAKEKVEYFDEKQNPKQQSLFSFYGIEKEITAALSRSVPLKSGGYLVIEQTEALVSIDVNSGSFVGTGKNEATKSAFVQVNVEAAAMIAQQLRLRNLGGIIVIDFIDMQNTKHQQTIFNALKRALTKDKTPTTVFPFSPLGLIEMTRKRTNKSLTTLMSKPCSQCDGTGLLPRD